MAGNSLRRQIAQIGTGAGAEAVAVAFYDYETRTGWSVHEERWFHAASTIKVPVLLGVFAAVEGGDTTLDSRVHVRNRFVSVVDGRTYTCDSARDADPHVQRMIGRTMKIKDLAFHMIVTSSNLATNLLIEIVGLKRIQETLRSMGLDGIEFHRGVEDEAAYEAGINNRVTAQGLLRALRLIEEKEAISKRASEQMLEILHAQVFRSGIPAGLPDDARVAHKTGEISTVAHDAGIVYLKDRAPYVLVILTEWKPDATRRSAAIASISRSVYEHLIESDA
jgi:beta-lactamase class A